MYEYHKQYIDLAMNKMIDIHNHLIPKFDDGPQSLDESIEMLRQASAQGITDVFATSHFNEYIPKEMEDEYFSKLQELREEVLTEGIGVNIYSGSEIFYHHYVDTTIKSNKVTTLGGWGQYVLIEFPMFQMPDGVEDVLFRLSVENYIPIVAHPERYNAIIERPQKALDFIRYGGLLQLNGGSVLGHFGREVQKVSIQLLEDWVVHFIGSDAHSPDSRTFVLQDVYSFLKDKFSESYLNQLLYKNPQKIIDEVRIEKVHLPSQKKNEGFLGKLKKQFKKSFQ